MLEYFNYLLADYNVWFTAPLALVFIFAIFRLIMGGMDFGDADVDADADVDVAVDAEVDVAVDAEVDIDADVDADAEVDAEADADAEGHSGSFVDILGFLNVGRVPVMVVLMSLFATWGISGLIANTLFNVPENPTWFWASCIVAFLCSLIGTRYLTFGVSKLFPESERAITDAQLLGMRGRVISGQITTTFGTVRVQVPDGPALTVNCRIKTEQVNPVKGDTVILVNYDDEKRIFDVKKAEAELQ